MQTTTQRNQTGTQAADAPLRIHCIGLANGDGRLENEVLREHTAARALKKGWDYPTLKLVSFKEGTIEWKNTWNRQSHRLVITVAPHQLHIGCNCEREENKLCLHAYKAIRRLMDYHGDGCFQPFLPGGRAALALAYPRYFETEWQDERLHIRKKSSIGRVYIPGTDEAPAADLEQVVSLSATQKPAPHPQALALCYFLLESPRRRIAPAVIPCLGKLTKDGTSIKGFGHFLSGTGKEYDHLLTAEQKELNSLCLELWKSSHGLPGTLVSTGLPINEERLEKTLNHWKRIFPLLCRQPFVFHYPLYWERDLRGKPQKSNTTRIRPCMESPQLAFRLTKKEDFHQLEMLTTVKEKTTILSGVAPPPFFLCQKNQWWLLPSLRDAALAEWMQTKGPKITVFPIHYPTFEKNIVQPLEKAYRIERLRK